MDTAPLAPLAPLDALAPLRELAPLAPSISLVELPATPLPRYLLVLTPLAPDPLTHWIELDSIVPIGVVASAKRS